jgi:hypothetical protein
MYIIAVTRWGKPFEEEITDLARLLDAHPYDLRLKLAGRLPVVLARLPDAEQARKLLATLRERTHGAVACDGDKILSSERMVTPRTFEIGEASVTVDDPTREPEPLAYSDLLALVHARIETETRITTTSQSRKFSMGRAVMTGGVVLTKKVSKQSRSMENDFEQVLYVFRRSAADPVLLRQNTLRYSGLGSAVGHSSMENFSLLIRTLRERAPQALYDNRLLQRRRQPTMDTLRKGGSNTKANLSIESISNSNANEVDLAAYLVALAHHAGQL